jgi:hypothetical protein
MGRTLSVELAFDHGHRSQQCPNPVNQATHRKEAT